MIGMAGGHSIELVRPGYSHDDVAKVAGGNILGVMRRAEAVASRPLLERQASAVLIVGLEGGADPRRTPATGRRTGNPFLGRRTMEDELWRRPHSEADVTRYRSPDSILSLDLRKFRVVAVVVIAAGRLAAAASAPIPLAGAVEDWVPTGAAKVYRGAELYGYINGGSEIFLELGFERLDIQDYTGGGGEISLEVYQMVDTAAARAIYGSKCGHETPSPELAVRNTVGRYQLAMQMERYYVVINNPAGTRTLVPMLVSFARAVAALLPEEKPVEVFSLLPSDGLVEGSQRVIRGPYALQLIITLGDGDILSLGGELTAVAADYAAGDATSTLVLCDYGDEARAGAAFSHLAANLDSYLDEISRDEDRLVFKDHAGRFGFASRTGAILRVLVNLPELPASS